MIIDAHTHLGQDCVFDLKNTKYDLLSNFEKYGIDGAIVQPFIERPYLEETRRIHDEIHDLCMEHPGRFWGMASINPHFRPEDYEREAQRCVKELGFVGLKITPAGHAINPASKDGMHVFEVARALNVPVMVHTGNGIPFADPAGIYPAAKAFPDVELLSLTPEPISTHSRPCTLRRTSTISLLSQAVRELRQRQAFSTRLEPAASCIPQM